MSANVGGEVSVCALPAWAVGSTIGRANGASDVLGRGRERARWRVEDFRGGGAERRPGAEASTGYLGGRARQLHSQRIRLGIRLRAAVGGCG